MAWNSSTMKRFATLISDLNNIRNEYEKQEK